MTNRKRAGIALLVLVQGLAATACGDASVAPNTMTAPSPTGGPPSGGGAVSGGLHATHRTRELVKFSLYERDQPR